MQNDQTVLNHWLTDRIPSAPIKMSPWALVPSSKKRTTPSSLASAWDIFLFRWIHSFGTCSCRAAWMCPLWNRVVWWRRSGTLAKVSTDTTSFVFQCLIHHTIREIYKNRVIRWRYYTCRSAVFHSDRGNQFHHSKRNLLPIFQVFVGPVIWRLAAGNVKVSSNSAISEL